MFSMWKKCHRLQLSSSSVLCPSLGKAGLCQNKVPGGPSTNKGKIKRGGGGRDERFGRKSFSSVVLKTDTNFNTNINSLFLSLKKRRGWTLVYRGEKKKSAGFPRGAPQ